MAKRASKRVQRTAKERAGMRGVSSSAIRAIGYQPKTKKLDVEFRKGSVYRYSGVSSGAASRLRNAGSIGRHFVRNVRLEYPYTKIRGGRPRKGAKGKR